MSAITVDIRKDGVALLTLDVPGKPVNTLSTALIAEMESLLAPTLDDPDVRAIAVASAKPDCFIAGADLDGLDDVRTAAEAAKLSRDGHALLDRVARSPKPVVAAVHGACLGGGLEVALACHYILASEDPKTVLGLPEVMLGLLPGGGGTQRLVDRVGLTAALPMMLAGQRVRARKALKLGLVDAVTTAGGIAETACRAALALASGKLERKRPTSKRRLEDAIAGIGPARGLVLRKAREEVMRKTRGLYPAPLAILECVEEGLAKGQAAGLEAEEERFGRLVVSPESRNLVWLFHAMTDRKKRPVGATTPPVSRLAVLGAGFMGAGVAGVSLGECPVVVRDVSDGALASCGAQVRKGLDAQVRSGAIRKAERDRRLSRLLLTSRVEDVAGADLVIEAVFEDLALKRKVIAEVEPLLAEDAVFASNTSALPISQIAAEARHPERVLGMHYFSPVHQMPLLEIVVTDRTSAEALAKARAFGAAQGKSMIVVKDGPGFYTTRIVAAYLSEALALLEEGAPTDSVDRAMRDFGFPVGPLALIDEVGIDVGAHVTRDLSAAFADRGFRGGEGLPKMAEAGFKGKKNRKGFYLYPAGKRKGPKQPDPTAYEHFGGPTRKEIATAEVQDRIALVMVNAAAYCLGEGVIASPADGDVGAILGLGFPPFRGGPFHYVDALGAGEVVRRLEALAARLGPRFEPAAPLRDNGRSGARFHP